MKETWHVLDFMLAKTVPQCPDTMTAGTLSWSVIQYILLPTGYWALPVMKQLTHIITKKSDLGIEEHHLLTRAVHTLSLALLCKADVALPCMVQNNLLGGGGDRLGRHL